MRNIPITLIFLKLIVLLMGGTGVELVYAMGASPRGGLYFTVIVVTMTVMATVCWIIDRLNTAQAR